MAAPVVPERQDDRAAPVLVHGAGLPWLPSPEAGVERRVLERIGGEVALATSIVRYAPGSRFPAHVHGLGEEFLVLEGVFSDEQGDYPAGTYVRNPPGSRHAPYSRDGCVIFVKLRQMHPADRLSLRLPPQAMAWRTGAAPGVRLAPLHAGGGVAVHMVRMEPGAALAIGSPGQAQEILVIAGEAVVEGDAGQAMARWSWLRWPRPHPARVVARSEAWLWTKAGHLTEAPGTMPRDR